MDEQMRKDYEAWREKSIWWTVCRPDQHDDSTGDAASTGRLMNIAAWEAWQAASALSQPAAQEIDELKTICAETYQVVGSLASDLGIFGSCLQLGKVLDNLSQQKRVHNDVLPWPSFEAQGDSSHPATVESFIGESEQADFDADTWTFKMQPGYSVGAGFYRITYIGLTAPKATA